MYTTFENMTLKDVLARDFSVLESEINLDSCCQLINSIVHGLPIGSITIDKCGNVIDGNKRINIIQLVWGRFSLHKMHFYYDLRQDTVVVSEDVLNGEYFDVCALLRTKDFLAECNRLGIDVVRHYNIDGIASRIADYKMQFCVIHGTDDEISYACNVLKRHSNAKL